MSWLKMILISITDIWYNDKTSFKDNLDEVDGNHMMKQIIRNIQEYCIKCLGNIHSGYLLRIIFLNVGILYSGKLF